MKLLSRHQAIQSGSIRYYTGNPCVHGHTAQRNTITGACLECMGVYSRNRRKKEIDRLAIQQALAMQEHTFTLRGGDIPTIDRCIDFINRARLTPGAEDLIRIFDEFTKSMVDSL